MASFKIFLTFFIFFIFVNQSCGVPSRKKVCGQLLHQHIQNICQTTDCQKLVSDGSIIETLDYKSRCCTLGCSHHQYQSLCCYDTFVVT
uniref:Uncharacterized protein n=1 Tax=Panagrolaimus sp. ES5 TaxID=591445 RepID=A0AC34GNZ2_9BILA